MTKTINQKQLLENIGNLKSDMKNAQQRVQKYLLQSVTLTIKNGDVDTLTTLYKALPASIRRKAFMQAVTDNLPLEWSQNKKGEAMFRLKNYGKGEKGKAKLADKLTTGLKFLTDNPWYELADGKENTQKEVMKLISAKRAKGRLKALYSDLEKTIDAGKLADDELKEVTAIFEAIKVPAQKFVN